MEKQYWPAPTKNHRILFMEQLLHSLNAARTAGDSDRLNQLLNNIDDWSYAHRQGNGSLSEREQTQLIRAAFWTKIGGLDYGEM